MIEAFRVAIRAYAKPLSGKGAAISGGRWNSVGVELVYTSSNRSLAMVEVVVNMPPISTPRGYVMVTIGIPEDISIEDFESKKLPRDWAHNPYRTSTQVIGDRFVTRNKCCVLRVPSAVTAGDTNLLINPKHKDFAKIGILAIEDFAFDRRMMK